MNCRCFIAFFVASLALSGWNASAKDWPEFCGSSCKNMVSGEKNLPDSFEPGKKNTAKGEIILSTASNVVWGVRTSANTYSSPTVAGGKIFISVSDAHKKKIAEVARQFVELGFELVATSGTAEVLEKAGLKVERIFKLTEGRPNAVDLLKNKEVQLVINTPSGATPRTDEIKIRTTAVYTGTPIMTTISSARAAASGIAALKKSGYAVKTVQEYH